MTMELSKMFGMDIYSTDAEYVGKAYDFVIDLGEGKISKITLEPLKVRSKREVTEILKKKSVSYEKVVAVKDMVLIDPKKTNNNANPVNKQTPLSAGRNAVSRLGFRRPIGR